MRTWSNLAFLWVAVLIITLFAISASEARYLKRPTFKQARAIRGFKSMPLNVGRGFGKRADDQEFLLDAEDNGFADDSDAMAER